MDYIINELEGNRDIFNVILSGIQKELYLWKPLPEKWCMLEVICHLYDEEREDFKARTKLILETPNEQFKSIDPQGWVKDRKYIERDYSDMLQKFLSERKESVKWLRSLNNPDWNKTYNHPKFGDMSAKQFLASWLAHDYLHIRQITKLKYDYLKQISSENISYAGEW
jgi:hypothetical protein